ncbi:MAG: GAF domain-containing protein [Acholeplasmataceae bacterium]|nr:GAF domain-containing protein [Acholeplasmataceae bacterium]
MELLLKSAEALFQESKNNTSLLANASSFIMDSIKDLNWVGFYLMENNRLIVGPFQGKPACVEIQVGDGVCGKAFKLNKVLNVKNVHLFEGHIACDSDSNSELVIPLVKNDIKIGVLDIDSPVYNRFDADLQSFFESFAKLLLTYYEETLFK